MCPPATIINYTQKLFKLTISKGICVAFDNSCSKKYLFMNSSRSSTIVGQKQKYKLWTPYPPKLNYWSHI